MTNQSTSDLKRLERARCDALVSADYPSLAALLADDLVHIHANGLHEGKVGYLEGIRTKLDFLTVERSTLTIRVYGEVAIMTGPLDQTVRVKGPDVIVTVKAMLTQVWRRDAGEWRLCSFQATKIE